MLYGPPGIKLIAAALVIVGMSLALVLTAVGQPAAMAQSVTVPGAPTHLTVTPGDARATMEWAKPSSDGGSEITRYEHRLNAPTHPSLVLTPRSLHVTEGSSSGSSYNVKLATQPTAEVTVSIAGTSGTDLSLDKSSLTFTTQNWSTAQTVTVTAAHDTDESDDAATLAHAASGGDYEEVEADLPVTVGDDETASLVLSKSFLALEEGGTTSGSYTVRLSKRPTGDVTVAIAGHEGTDLTLRRTSLIFTTGNWSDAQTVTVAASQDTDRTNDRATLTHSASGGGFDGGPVRLPVVVSEPEWASTEKEQNAAITGLTNGAEYTFEVRAVNSEGPGEAASVLDVPFVELVTDFASCWYCVILGARHSINEGDTAEFQLRRFYDEELTVTLMMLEHNDHGSTVAAKELGKRRVTFGRGQRDLSVFVPTISDDRYSAYGDGHPSIVAKLMPGHGYAVPPMSLGGTSGEPYATQTITVLDDDFPPGVEVTGEAGMTTVREGQSTTVTFKLTSPSDRPPHRDAGNYTLSVTGGDTGDYTIEPTEFSVPLSAFERPGYNDRYVSTYRAPHVATLTATFTAVDDQDGELSEDFTVSLQKGDGAPDNLDMPDSLTLTIPKSDLPEFSIRSPYPDSHVHTESDGQLMFEITRDVPVSQVQPLSIQIYENRRIIDGEHDTVRTINIGPEATSRLIYVQLDSDHKYEGHSTITATILDDAGDDGFMINPQRNSAHREVEDDDFPRGVRLGIEADRAVIMEGQSAELTFTFRAGKNMEPHADGGTFQISVQGGSAADYSLSSTTISAPKSAFSTGPDGHPTASTMVTFTALTDSLAEDDEEFTVSVSRGEDAQESIALPDSLTLTISETTGPGLPRSVTAVPFGNGGIYVTWEAPASTGGSDITGYVVQWKKASSSWDVADDVSQASTQNRNHTITGLDHGTRYSVRVTAINAVESGLPSGETTALTNTPATGAPAVSGRWVQVGWTLTADTSGIRDADGLLGVSYFHRWVRVDGETESNIRGANGTSYTLQDSDEGKTIKVRVYFTDDGGNAETLISAPSSVVYPEPKPLEASFLVPPQSHDGENTFSFELRFSEEPREDFSYKVLRDYAFTVTGGRVVKTPRMTRPHNILWNIIVQPDGDGDVTIVLPPTTNCGDPGAICTGDGRMLSNRTTLTVLGP